MREGEWRMEEERPKGKETYVGEVNVFMHRSCLAIIKMVAERGEESVVRRDTSLLIQPPARISSSLPLFPVDST